MVKSNLAYLRGKTAVGGNAPAVTLSPREARLPVEDAAGLAPSKQCIEHHYIADDGSDTTSVAGSTASQIALGLGRTPTRGEALLQDMLAQEAAEAHRAALEQAAMTMAMVESLREEIAELDDRDKAPAQPVPVLEHQVLTDSFLFRTLVGETGQPQPLSGQTLATTLLTEAVEHCSGVEICAMPAALRRPADHVFGTHQPVAQSDFAALWTNFFWEQSSPRTDKEVEDMRTLLAAVFATCPDGLAILEGMKLRLLASRHCEGLEGLREEAEKPIPSWETAASGEEAFKFGQASYKRQVLRWVAGLNHEEDEVSEFEAMLHWILNIPMYGQEMHGINPKAAESKSQPAACPTIVEIRLQELQEVVANPDATDEQKQNAADQGQVAALALAEQLQERIRAEDEAPPHDPGNAEGVEGKPESMSAAENLRLEIQTIKEKLVETEHDLATLAAGPPGANAEHEPARQAVHTFIALHAHIGAEAVQEGLKSWSAACELAPRDAAIMSAKEKKVSSTASYATISSVSSLRLIKNQGGPGELRRQWQAACTANQVRDAKEASEGLKRERLARQERQQSPAGGNAPAAAESDQGLPESSQASVASIATSAATRSSASSGFGMLQVDGLAARSGDSAPPLFDNEDGRLATEGEGPPPMFLENWMDFAVKPEFLPSTPIPEKVIFQGKEEAATGWHYNLNGANFTEWKPAQTRWEREANTPWNFAALEEPPAGGNAPAAVQSDRWKRTAFMRFGFTERRDMVRNAGMGMAPPTPDSGENLPPHREWTEEELANDDLWMLCKQNGIPMYLLGEEYNMKAENINGPRFNDEQHEAHRLRIGKATDFASGTTLQQEMSRKPGLVDKGFGSADLLLRARASSPAMEHWAHCVNGFRVSSSIIDKLRNVLMHWTDATLYMIDPDVARCDLHDRSSFENAPCAEQRQEHFIWWFGVLNLSARRLAQLLGGSKGTPTPEATCEWLVMAARHLRRLWFPVNTMPVYSVRELLEINALLPHPLAVRTEVEALWLGYRSQKYEQDLSSEDVAEGLREGKLILPNIKGAYHTPREMKFMRKKDKKITKDHLQVFQYANFWRGSEESWIQQVPLRAFRGTEANPLGNALWESDPLPGGYYLHRVRSEFEQQADAGRENAARKRREKDEAIAAGTYVPEPVSTLTRKERRAGDLTRPRMSGKLNAVDEGPEIDAEPTLPEELTEKFRMGEGETWSTVLAPVSEAHEDDKDSIAPDPEEDMERIAAEGKARSRSRGRIRRAPPP